MNYGAIKYTDIANGEGVRISLFVSGCRFHCKGCFNQETWDFDYGKPFDESTMKDILTRIKERDYLSGLSVLGGEPLDEKNRLTVYNLCRAVKQIERRQNRPTVWLYTGYHYEDVLSLPVMNYIDVLVDGPFIEDKKDISLRFRGSSNQRIIDVPASKKAGKVVLWESAYGK